MPKIKTCVFLLIGLTFFLCKAAYAEEEKQLELEPLLITKSRVHLLKPSTLTFDDLTGQEYDSAIEQLARLPVDLQARSPKAAIQDDFSLRGSTFQGVLMLLNGSRINDPQTAHHNADIPLTKEDLKRIDVLAGVSSSVFGPDAIGGAINFITKKPSQRGIVLEARGGQNKTWAGLFSVTEKIKNLGARLSVENEESDGFHLDTDFKKFTASLNSSLDLPLGGFNLNWGYQEKEFGAYDFYTPGSGYQSKEWTKTYLLNTGFDLEKNGFIIKPSFLWRLHFDKFLLDKTLIRSRYLNHHHTNIYTPAIYLQKELPYLGQAGLGLEYGIENISSTNLGKHSRDHESLYIDDSLDLSDGLSLGMSFRMDNFQVFRNIYTGSASLLYKLPKDNALRLAVSRSARVPSFTELYYSDPTTLGNSGLTAEKSVNYQLGLEHKKESLSLGAVFFFRDEDNFIDWVKSAPGQVKWQVENITAAHVLGVENHLKFKINNYLGLDCNYTYTNRDILQKDLTYKYGLNYARHLLNNVFNLRLPFGAQAVGFSYKKKPGRNGWFLLDAHLNYQFSKNARVFVNADNLLNIGYQEIEGVPSPGRWTEAGVRLSW